MKKYIHTENSAQGILAIGILGIIALFAIYLLTLIPTIVYAGILIVFGAICATAIIVELVAEFIILGIPALVYVKDLIYWAFMFTFKHDKLPDFPPKYKLLMKGTKVEIWIESLKWSALIVGIGLFIGLFIGLIINGCYMVVIAVMTPVVFIAIMFLDCVIFTVDI